MIPHLNSELVTIEINEWLKGTVTEHYRVTDQDLASYINAQQVIAAAPFFPGIPTIGTFHPLLPNSRVVSIEARNVADDRRSFDVLVRYEPRGELVMRGGSSPVTVELTHDAAGVQLTTEDSASGEIQTHRVQAMRPNAWVSVQKEYQAVVNPMVMQASYEGKVNALPWPGSNPSPAGTWLCTRFSWDDWRSGFVWTAHVEFERRADWKDRITHLDDEGRPVENPVAGFEQKDYLLYPSVDFAGLEISI